MKKAVIGVSLAVLAFGGAAFAQQIKHAGHDPFGDKTVTRAEAQAKALELFAKLDLNHDGKLDPADRALVEGKVFDRIDTNHDGSISREEFAAAHKPHGPEMGGHEMDGMDKDGHKDHHGGAMGGHMRGQMGKRMGLMMMLRMADTNHDGVVTKDEFTAAAMKHFDMADTNHDGQLTPAERKAAREKMHAMMRARMERHEMGDHGQAPGAPAPAPADGK